MYISPDIHKIKEANRIADSIEKDETLDGKNGNWVYHNSGHYLMTLINPFTKYKDKQDIVDTLRKNYKYEYIYELEVNDRLCNFVVNNKQWLREAIQRSDLGGGSLAAKLLNILDGKEYIMKSSLYYKAVEIMRQKELNKLEKSLSCKLRLISEITDKIEKEGCAKIDLYHQAWYRNDLFKNHLKEVMEHFKRQGFKVKRSKYPTDYYVYDYIEVTI